MTSLEDYNFSDQPLFKLGGHGSDSNNNFNINSGTSNFHDFIPSQELAITTESNGFLNQNYNLLENETSNQSTVYFNNHQQFEDLNESQLELNPSQTNFNSFQFEPIIPANSFVNETGFPPVDAFAPAHVDKTIPIQAVNSLQNQINIQSQIQNLSQIPTTLVQPQLQLEPQIQHQYQPLQRSRYLSEPNVMTPINQTFSSVAESAFSLSPESMTFSTSNSALDSKSSSSSTVDAPKSTYKRYRVIRGISSGGSATKPPRALISPNFHYAAVTLQIINAELNELCLPRWNEAEKEDKRRIIRIERFQVGAQIIAQFSIVGSAQENPNPKPSKFGVDVVEVSCLQCFEKPNEDTDDEENFGESNDYSYKPDQNNEVKRSFYITSVEVIKIVELLIGTDSQEAAERRRERGRIRSNLVPFWSKRPISSRMSNSELRSSPISSPDPTDFRLELATRIMAYDVRKPRGFDKEVRILRWEKLVPALRRALQSYYVELPDNFEESD